MRECVWVYDVWCSCRTEFGYSRLCENRRLVNVNEYHTLKVSCNTNSRRIRCYDLLVVRTKASVIQSAAFRHLLYLRLLWIPRTWRFLLRHPDSVLYTLHGFVQKKIKIKSNGFCRTQNGRFDVIFCVSIGFLRTNGNRKFIDGEIMSMSFDAVGK